MKAIVLSQKNINITGGQKINHRMYDIFSKSEISIDFSYDLFNCSYNIIFMINILLNIKKISTYNFVIIDSSSFPKTTLFVFLCKFLFPSLKIITTHHHYCSDFVSGPKGFIYKKIEKIFLSRCDIIIIFSPYIYDRLTIDNLAQKSFYVGLPFEQKNIEKKIKNNAKLLFVGTIEERKGLIYLIQSLGFLPDELRKNVELNIIGKEISTSYRKKLDNEIKKLNLEQNVFFRGRVDAQMLEMYFKSSYLFVFPSLLEGFGMVMVEAMNYGLPVVAFDNSAMPYVIESGKNGIIVRNKDYKEMGKAIEKILTDYSLYEKLSNGAKKNAKNFLTYDAFDKNISNFINKLKEEKK